MAAQEVSKVGISLKDMASREISSLTLRRIAVQNDMPHKLTAMAQPGKMQKLNRCKDLLIRQTALTILMPLDIRMGRWDEPFATRMPLGLAVRLQIN